MCIRDRFEIDYIGCPFRSELNIKCVLWCTSSWIRPHQHTSLNCVTSPVSESANRGHLRSAAWGDLAVTHSRTTRYGQRYFAVAGPTLWNSLPLSTRDPWLTLTQFCAHLKTELFCRLMIHYLSTYVTVSALRIVPRTQICLLAYLKWAVWHWYCTNLTGL